MLAHPLRLRLLSLLTGRALSGAEAARELGDTQANVSYHLRRLHAAGLVTPVEDPGQLGRARRYRHEPVSGEKLTLERSADHQLLMAALAAELQRRSFEHRAGSTGTFTDAELWVDADAWSRALAAAREVGALLHDNALPPADEGAVRVSATISLFELAEPAGPTDPEVSGR